MDIDFLTFQTNLLLSLKQEAPLDENLRAVMAPALSKLQSYCGATIAVHAFVNPELHNIHAMILGTSLISRRAVDDELRRRHGLAAESLAPRAQLPGYSLVELITGSDLPEILGPLGEVRVVHPSAKIILFFRQLQALFPNEFSEPFIAEDDKIILMPLGTEVFRRLGCIILWAPSDSLVRCAEQPHKLEYLIAFRRGMEQLLIRLFTNFYQIEPHTYIPSYYRIEQKPVALLCTEIREFDRISEVLRLRRDIEPKKAMECLRQLVNDFSELAAKVIEKNHRGRVDQIWGNGLLAVFGEYLDTPEVNPRIVCMRATMAAAEFVERFREVAETWLKQSFDLEKFQESHSEMITLAPAVVVDYGDVVFDYIGSSKHRVYMALGDHINFIKQLVHIAGRTESDPSNPEFLLRQIIALLRRDLLNPKDEFYLVAPILLSQAAYTWSKGIIKDRKSSLTGEVHRARIIHLPGKFTPYSVYEIWPENVDRATSK